MSKWVWIFVLILMVVFIVFPSYQYYKARKTMENYKTDYLITKSNFDIFQQSVNEAMSKTILSDDRKLFPAHCYKYGKQTIDSIYINQLANKVLLIIPEKSCNTCYDDVYGFIKYAQDSLDVSIVPLTTKKRYREITNILTDFAAEENLYYVSDKFLEGQNEIEFAPYFVFVDQDLICRQLFIPQANHSYLTKTYLKSVKLKFGL